MSTTPSFRACPPQAGNALANGLRRDLGLWSYDRQAKIAFLPLPPHASYRRRALQALYRKMEEEIENLAEQVAKQAAQRCGARLLLTHPGVGPVTALATDVFLSDPQRFADGKALASYVSMIPREYSNGERQRLGALTKQGSPLLRFLWLTGAAALAEIPLQLWLIIVGLNSNRWYEQADDAAIRA